MSDQPITPTPLLPPIAKEEPHLTQHHDDSLDDRYHWLRDENWQQVMRDPSQLDNEIRTYLEAENEYCQAMMSDEKVLRETLFKEMKGRIKEDDQTVPSNHGAHAYYISYVEGGEYALYCRTVRDGSGKPDEPTEILLDGNAMGKDKAYFNYGAIDHSPDHNWVAWCQDIKGSEYFSVFFRNIESGDDLEYEIEDTTGSGCWANDSKTFFYVKRDDNHRPAYVYRHTVGEDPSNDELVYSEPDPGFFVNLGRTQSGRFIAINASGHETSEWHLIDADQPQSKPQLVAKREAAHEYALEERHGQLYILTNDKGAEDFKIVKVDVQNPAKDHWQDLIPHQAGTLILSHLLFEDYLVRMERHEGLPRIIVRHLETGQEHTIQFDEQAYSLGLSAGYEFETDRLRFTYSSMTTPSEVYDYNMHSRERQLRKRQSVPSGHDPADYRTARILARAHDGEQIPISLLYHKTTKLDGTAPLLLYGYGSYGISIPASFSTNRLSLVDRGFIYAIAHIRGGKDKGYHWYKTGKLEQKTNSFKDFISCGETLIAENYTAKGRIIAQGGSAGGMLMGAVANMAPELFGAIIAEVPFVDVLNTMLDDSLPLTPPEWPEWGNPIEDKDAFATIKSYSPYDNVEAKAYPPMLVIAGLTDPRVTYWEPAKWVAKLRAHKTDKNLLLLKTNMEAGHAGAAGRFDYLKEVAFSTSFALKVAANQTV